MVDDLRPLGDLEGERETLARQGGQKLYLRLPSEFDPIMGKVRLALGMFPGDTEVLLVMADSGKRFGTRCGLTATLHDDLIQWLGKENVILR